MTSPPGSLRSRWLAFRLLLVERLPAWGPNSMLLWAALAGVGGSLATVAFREVVRAVQWLLTHEGGGLVQAAMALPWWQRLLTPALGGLLAGALLALVQRLPGSKTAPDYMEAVAIGNGHIAVTPTLVRSLSSGLSVGSGAAIGREGSMVQLSAVVASWLGRIASFNESRRRLLVACGAAGPASHRRTTHRSPGHCSCRRSCSGRSRWRGSGRCWWHR